jgi:preprotein translocase subunit SecG
MIYNLLLVLLVIDSVVLVAAILAQAGKGTGLAASFGGASSSPDAFIGIRQAGNLLTKMSWWCGGLFLFLAFVLQLMSTRVNQPRSILEKSLATPAPTAPAPTSTPAVPLQQAPTPQAKTPPASTPKR